MKKFLSRDQIITNSEFLIEKVQEKIDSMVKNELQRCVDDWASRYPRHKFEAWQGHGMLYIEVSPSIFGFDEIENIPKDVRRGAIKTIFEECENLKDWYNKIEFCLVVSDGIRVKSKT